MPRHQVKITKSQNESTRYQNTALCLRPHMDNKLVVKGNYAVIKTKQSLELNIHIKQLIEHCLVEILKCAHQPST